ncbi:MAG: hypothetical protein ACKOTB_03400, partial [Planctomycetia bacterium]
DVLRVVEGPDELTTAVTTELAARSRAANVLLDAWRHVSTAEADALRGISFAELAERTRVAAEPMYYI